MHQFADENMKRLSPENAIIPDLLWISKQQQQHPSTHVHPLKNTIRLNSQGQRCKFDGRQWRPLCETLDGTECRNLAFRSSLCQKHFYKIHIFKRSYVKAKTIQPISLKRSLLTKYEQQSKEQNYNNQHTDDSIELIQNEKHKIDSEFRVFSIDSTIQQACHSMDVESDSKTFLNHSNNPQLTRTEEKSLANEFIYQFPIDLSFEMAERIARRRACEIVFDNYSQRISSENISNEWFYDFLLRNPRIPIHFQSWFASVPLTLPTTDHMIAIKIWQLGLVTRSILSLSSSSSSSP